jgi:hypothetical protein
MDADLGNLRKILILRIDWNIMCDCRCRDPGVHDLWPLSVPPRFGHQLRKSTTMSHSAFRANSLSDKYRGRCPVCSRTFPLPVFLMAASSSYTNPIIRSGENCRHSNFNSYPAITPRYVS